MKKSILKANKTILALAILVLPFANVKSQNALQFEEETWNFGERYLAEEFEHQFMFKNNCNHSVVIDTVLLSSVSSLSVDYSKLPIAPGETSYINLKCNFKENFPGHIKRTITIKTLPDNNTIKIFAEGNLTNTFPPRLKKETPFGDYYQIHQNGKFGIEDNNGKTILKTEYDDISWWGKIVIVRKDKKRGVYDLKGKSILPVIYDFIDKVFFQELLIIRKGEYECVYDLNGNCIIPLERKYTEISFAKDDNMGTYYCFFQGRLFGLCDRTGKEVWSHDLDQLLLGNIRKKRGGESVIRSIKPVFRKGRFCLIVFIESPFIIDGKGKIVVGEGESGFSSLRIKEDGMIVGSKIEKNEGFVDVNIGYIDSFVGTTDNPLQGNNH